ncbi:reverse transcriptase family protein [Patescibacteria group bacterium]|nr:reverse transcriptase family protein [Patescibacteria group bacterium]
MITPGRKEAISELAVALEISPNLINRALQMITDKTAYNVWSTPKKSGGERQIQAANWPLNEIQSKIAAEIYPYSVSEINHAFVAGRSHRTAVLPHLRANAFFSFDIKDAFPSVSRRQVLLKLRLLSVQLGLKDRVAELITDLVCYSPTGKSEHGFLPQGYRSSPHIFNLVLKDIDRILAGFAQKRGYQITRFVDDFLISTTEKAIPREDRRLVIKLVENLGGFKISPEKISYLESEGNDVHFEFLGLAIKGPREGERTMGVAEKKLNECRWIILGAMEQKDFSKKTFRRIKGKVNYIKGIYKSQGKPLPAKIADVFAQYRSLRAIADADKNQQVLFKI